MVSVVSNVLRPSMLVQEVSSYVSTRDGGKDTLEAVINCFDWMAHLGINQSFAETACKDLEPVKKMYSIPSFFHHLNELRHEYTVYDQTQSSEASRKLFNRAMLTTSSGSEATLFGNSLGFVELGKEGLKIANTLFWAPLFLYESVSFFYEIEQAEFLTKEMNASYDDQVKNILNHKIQIKYLNVLKSVTTLAMASISLVSILFAAMAQGILFSCGAMLALTSVWLVLNFVIYFYERMITQWEKALPLGKV